MEEEIILQEIVSPNRLTYDAFYDPAAPWLFSIKDRIDQLEKHFGEFEIGKHFGIFQYQKSSTIESFMESIATIFADNFISQVYSNRYREPTFNEISPIINIAEKKLQKDKDNFVELVALRTIQMHEKNKDIEMLSTFDMNEYLESIAPTTTFKELLDKPLTITYLTPMKWYLEEKRNYEKFEERSRLKINMPEPANSPEAQKFVQDFKTRASELGISFRYDNTTKEWALDIVETNPLYKKLLNEFGIQNIEKNEKKGRGR